MPPSDTSADCVTVFCATLSRTTVKIRYGLRDQAPAQRANVPLNVPQRLVRKDAYVPLMVTEMDLHSINTWPEMVYLTFLCTVVRLFVNVRYFILVSLK